MPEKVISVAENPFRLGAKGLEIVGTGARVLFRRKNAREDEPFTEVIYLLKITKKALESARESFGPSAETLEKFRGKYLVESLCGEIPHGRSRMISNTFVAEIDEIYWDESKSILGENLRKYLLRSL